VSIPNAIPSLSATTNLVYAIGQRNGVWGLEGVDFANGESVLRVDSSVLPFSNSFYADTEIAPDSSIWTGTFGGVEIFRPAALP
jgi:hypothetical protein